MANRLQGKSAIVTGSDSGIGQATAEEFAKEGADVVVIYLQDHGGAEETRHRVEAAGRRALVCRLDQREPTEVKPMFDETERRLGKPVVKMPLEDWDNEMRTNLYGPFYCCQHFIRARKAAGGRGKIINVTSVHQEIPRAGAAGYDPAKGGLRNLTRTLCLELAPDHINANNIAPGMVLTPMNQSATDDHKVREEQVQSIPRKRAAEPREIAKLAVYLASEEADYVTGQTFTIDGGLEMNMGQGA